MIVTNDKAIKVKLRAEFLSQNLVRLKADSVSLMIVYLMAGGLLILDRYLQQNGINPVKLSLLDRLAFVGSTGRGALEFRPDKSVVSRQDYADFEKLALKAENGW
jgi:hypothetical protein